MGICLWSDINIFWANRILWLKLKRFKRIHTIKNSHEVDCFEWHIEELERCSYLNTMRDKKVWIVTKKEKRPTAASETTPTSDFTPPPPFCHKIHKLTLILFLCGFFHSPFFLSVHVWSPSFKIHYIIKQHAGLVRLFTRNSNITQATQQIWTNVSLLA